MRRFAPTFLFLFVAAALAGQSGGALSAPTGLEASDGAYSTKVGLSWEHIRGATLYEIYRGASKNPGAAVSVGSTSSVIFFDTTAEPGQAYSYWVQATSASAKSIFSAPAEGFRAEGLTQYFGKIAPLGPPPEPAENPVTGAKVYLGKTLFWDEQLSSTRTVACGTCHRPRSGSADPRSSADPARSTNPGADGRFGTGDDVIGSPGVPLAGPDGVYVWSPDFGFDDQVTGRKAQSVVDAAFSDNGLFWDGRAEMQFKDPLSGETVIEDGAALESQALGPLTSDVEMGHAGRKLSDVVAHILASRPLALSPSVPAALARWIGERSYPELFAEAFGDPEVTPVRIAMAIASYERTLFSDRARIDAVVSGLVEATPAEKRGRELFFDSDCDACHRGTLLGDNRFRYIGLRPHDDDRGRYDVSGNPVDLGKFRTPSLRNVALRAPYMHDGRFSSLEEVIEFYNRGGDFDAFNKDSNFVRPLHLSEPEKSDMLAFLKGLTDPRVASEAAPLFDRPMLYSESARVPRIIDDGSGASAPQVRAVEPPIAGNPSFTVAVYGAPGGGRAVLVIDEADPGTGPEIPASASFFRGEVRLTGTGAGKGRGAVSLPIPDDPALVGKTLYGRWFVRGAVSVLASPAFEIRVFEATGAPPEAPAFSSVSAASLAIGFVTPESLVSGFGRDLSSVIVAASSLPPPVMLGGVSVQVTDSEGVERPAPLLYVSPSQINYQIPPGTAWGEATVRVLRAGAIVAVGKLQVAAAAPALFSANANGRGPAAALVLRIKADGSRSFEPAARFDAAQGRFVPAPIDLGPEGDQVFLILFGVGIRFHGPGGIGVEIGGEPAEVIFAGAQPEFVGLDQVNVRISRSLAGKGETEVVVTADALRSNAVRIEIR